MRCFNGSEIACDFSKRLLCGLRRKSASKNVDFKQKIECFDPAYLY